MRTISPSGSDSNSEPSGLAVRRDGLSSVSMNVEILLSMSSLSLAVFVITRTVIHCDSESVLLSITSASTLILRRGDVEAIAQGESNAARIVILHLADHHAITVEREAIDASIEKVIA